jgi:SEC-C motif-containing protein
MHERATGPAESVPPDEAGSVRAPGATGASGKKHCPCLSGLVYDECCGPLQAGARVAPTASSLMRSRYSAFAVGDAAYLLATWAPETRPRALELDASLRWYRLDIVGTTRGGLGDTEGTVEFVAHYRADGVAAQQHEVSRFAKSGGRWLYVDGR